MLTSLISLALLLAVLGALVWWVRRASPLGARQGRHLEIVETVALGPSHSLHLLRLGERVLLLAASRERCELISELESLPPEAPAAEARWAAVLRARLERP